MIGLGIAFSSSGSSFFHHPVGRDPVGIIGVILAVPLFRRGLTPLFPWRRRPAPAAARNYRRTAMRFRRAPATEAAPRRRRRVPSGARCRLPASSGASAAPSSAREERLRDLGGLMLEMYRRDQFRQDLLVDRCIELGAARGAARRPRRAARRRGLPRPQRGPRRAASAAPRSSGARSSARSADAPSPAPRRCRSKRHDAREASRLLPALRRRLRAAAGVLPRVRRAPADEPRRRRRPRVRVAAPLRVVPGRLDLARRSSSLLTVVATTAALAANSRARTGARRSSLATTPSVTVGPGRDAGNGPGRRHPDEPADRPRADDHDRPAADRAGLARRPGATTPAPPNPNALAVWPAGKSGYTVVLESLPVTGGRPPRVARARQAKRAGLQAGRRPRLVPVLEPPPRLLRRLLRDLPDPGRGDGRPSPPPTPRASRTPTRPASPARCKASARRRAPASRSGERSRSLQRQRLAPLCNTAANV